MSRALVPIRGRRGIRRDAADPRGWTAHCGNWYDSKLPAQRSKLSATSSASTERPTASAGLDRELASFYEDMAFPSRSSHAEYRRLLPDEPGERIGDFGCGQSLFHEALRHYSPSPVFLDRSRNALSTIDYGHRVRADLRRLPFPSASYDRVLCIGVLHHLSDRSEAFHELARVIRPGGALYLGVYAPGSLNARLRRVYDSVGFSPFRAIVFAVTAFLIQCRYAMRGKLLALEDVRMRTTDFLKVPFVHFAEPVAYEAEAKSVGLRLESVRRISSMNVLVLRQG